MSQVRRKMEGNLICKMACLTPLLFIVSDISLSYASVEGVLRTRDGRITGKLWLLLHSAYPVTLLTHTCAPQLQVIRANMALLLATKTDRI